MTTPQCEHVILDLAKECISLRATTFLALARSALRQELLDAHDVLEAPLSPGIHGPRDSPELARALFGDEPDSTALRESLATR